MGDITWFNDLIDPTASGDLYGASNESADALFSCETFETVDLVVEGPILMFGAFAGHCIEFKVSLYS